MASRRIDVHRAIERGDLALLSRYLDAGGDPHAKDSEYGASPGHWAALRGKVDAMQILLQRGANIESRTNTDGTVLVWGCMGGDTKMVRLLLDLGANVSAVTKGKGTALHHATHSGHPEVVTMLLEKGADPKAQDNRRERPGDNFDEEVPDTVRRSIRKTLAKARGDTLSSSRRLSRSRKSDRSRSERKPRLVEGGDADVADGVGDANGRGSHRAETRSEARPAGWPDQLEQTPRLAKPETFSSAASVATLVHGPLRPGWARSPLDDDDALVAAEAALAAAAWSPQNLVDNGTPGARHRDRESNGHPGDRGYRSENGYRPKPSSTAAAIAASAAADRRRSSAIPRLEIELESGFPRRSPPSDADSEMQELRAQVNEHMRAAEAAAEKDARGRAELRRMLVDLDERANEAMRAERARSEKLAALVQGLERRLRERDSQVQQLQAELDKRRARVKHEDDASEKADAPEQADAREPTLATTIMTAFAAYPARGAEGSGTASGRRTTYAPGDGGDANGAFKVTDGDGPRAEALDWWKRADWSKSAGGNGQGSAIGSKKQYPPLIEDHERIGSLYSMIARR